MRKEAGSAGLLLGATLAALLWANSPWSASYHAIWSADAGLTLGGWSLTMDLQHWVNDFLMALFFFVTHVFVVLYEEPTLRDAFGADYAAYCGEVGRWWPRIR